MNYTNFTDTFASLGPIAYSVTDVPDLSWLTSLNSMFEGTDFTADLSGWNTSTIQDMADMFSGSTSFNGDISTWDTSSVTDTSGIFFGATAFDQDLGGWDISSVTNMTGLLYGPASLEAREAMADQYGWTFSSDSFDTDGDDVSTIDDLDTDDDGIRDSRDIDSDNDGILDIIEAQATADFTGTSGTYVSGVDTGFGGGVTPVDTDGDGIADFRDSDSDDDGIADIAERGDGAPTSVTDTTDTGQDGLLDIFEGSDVTDTDADNEQIDGAEEAPYSFSASDFGFTDPNHPDPNTFSSVTITTLPSNGLLELSGVAVTSGQIIDVADIPNLTYTGNTDVSGAGADSLSFQVTDDDDTARYRVVRNAPAHPVLPPFA